MNMTESDSDNTTFPDPVVGGLYQDTDYSDCFLVVLRRCQENSEEFVCLDYDSESGSRIRHCSAPIIYLNYHLVVDSGVDVGSDLG